MAYSPEEAEKRRIRDGLQIGDQVLLDNGQLMQWNGSGWSYTGTKVSGTGTVNYGGGNGGDTGATNTGTTNTGTTNTGTTNTTGGTSPVSTADAIRAMESQTLQGRRGMFDRYTDAQAFNRFLNPLARAVMGRQFNPLSSQYMLASAPTAAGGAAQFNVADAGTGLTFQDFMTGERPAYTAAGGYGENMIETPIFGGEGQMNTLGSPWTRSDWQGRIANLFGDTAAMGTMPAMPGTGAVGDFLGGLSMAEAANMISNAQTAGLNPIVARSAPAGINRAIASWQQTNPQRSAAELLRSYVGGTNTGGGAPVFGAFV